MKAALGMKSPDAGTQVRWSSESAQVIYIDRNTRRCWIWLPLQVGNDDFVAIKADNGMDRIELGHVHPDRTDGQLTYFVLEQHQFASLETFKDFISLTQRPIAFPTIGRERTAYELLDGAHAESQTIRLVAWFASSLATLQQSPLGETLKTITIDDLFARHDRSKREVLRDGKLFNELIETIEKRRLVFVLGGRKSGVSAFLDQFKAVLPTHKTHGTHVTANFNGAIFSDISESLKDSPVLTGLNCEPDITSLFITLAYAAYGALLRSETTNQDSLADFVSRRADDYKEQFVVAYVQKLALISADSVPQVEAFIRFLAGMMRAAGRADTLTVILSITGFADWLRERRTRDKASDVERSLWKALRSFNLANYDGAGEPKRGSLMYDFADSIGIVVEIHRLAVAELAEGFCKSSVLVMPPYDDSELSQLWAQHFGDVPTDDMLRDLQTQTGGAPWFVELLLSCTEGATGDTPKLRMATAAATAKAILSGHSGVPLGNSLQIVKVTWEMYLGDLQERLSASARLDRNTLRLLNEASSAPVTNYATSHLPDWLESGLIWVRPERNVHSLRAFAKYPIIRTCPRGELLSHVIGLLTPGLTTENSA
jgi:hypothetical protein